MMSVAPQAFQLTSALTEREASVSSLAVCGYDESVPWFNPEAIPRGVPTNLSIAPRDTVLSIPPDIDYMGLFGSPTMTSGVPSELYNSAKISPSGYPHTDNDEALYSLDSTDLFSAFLDPVGPQTDIQSLYSQEYINRAFTTMPPTSHSISTTQDRDLIDLLASMSPDGDSTFQNFSASGHPTQFQYPISPPFLDSSPLCPEILLGKSPSPSPTSLYSGLAQGNPSCGAVLNAQAKKEEDEGKLFGLDTPRTMYPVLVEEIFQSQEDFGNSETGSSGEPQTSSYSKKRKMSFSSSSSDHHASSLADDSSEYELDYPPTPKKRRDSHDSIISLPGRVARGRKVPTSEELPEVKPKKTSKTTNRSNNGKRTHNCPHCQSLFFRSEHVKRHVRTVHLLDKPFSCNFPGCGKTFSRKDNLGQHQKTRH